MYKISMDVHLGAWEVRDEVHQDDEVAAQDEQLQLLPGPSLRLGLRAHQEARYAFIDNNMEISTTSLFYGEKIENYLERNS